MNWSRTRKTTVKRWVSGMLAIILLLLWQPAYAQFVLGRPANIQRIPKKILLTGTDLKDPYLSPNAMQLAEQLKLTSIFAQMQTLKEKLDSGKLDSQEYLQTRMQYMEAKQRAVEVIQKTELEVDFVLAEIADEQNLYSELLASFLDRRDRKIAIISALSFGLNGSLWAVAEAFTIPTHRQPRLSITAGIMGILAGIVPSIASAYALKEVTGGRYSAPAEPNMLAKFFNHPITLENEYPKSIWDFLNMVPAQEPGAASRRDQIIQRWIADKNIPHFTGNKAKDQINIITASVPQKRKLTIAVLRERLEMLQQLGGEVAKINRLLLELMLVVTGEKQLRPIQSNMP
jgi:hypothetical protein